MYSVSAASKQAAKLPTRPRFSGRRTYSSLGSWKLSTTARVSSVEALSATTIPTSG
jgi:hypothetical protein